MRSVFNACISWLGALIAAFAVLNAACLFYYHPTDAIAQSGQAGVGLKYPSDWGIYSNEGFAFTKIDENGLANATPLPESDYVLAIGSSHTEGYAVGSERRWTDVLNREYGIAAYNIGHSGYMLDACITRFDAIVQEFPGASTIVLETPILNYTEGSLTEALAQTVYAPELGHEEVIASLPLRSRLTHFLKSAFPLLRLLRLQALIMQADGAGSNWSTDDVAPEALYSEVLARIRSQFDGRIVIVFLPSETIADENTVLFSEQKTVAMFARCCEANGIDFLDMTPYFRDAYLTRHTVATGFWNTTMGSGHINADGHRMVADALAALLEE